jgi:hypothetical protein
LDGLTINVLYNSETSIDILQLEQSQELSSRNLEILNGLIGEDFVYYESDQYSPVDIVYPLMSYEQHEKLNKLEPILVRVLVRINNQSRNCLRDGNCIPIDSTSVKGIVKIGLENLRSSDFETLESDLLKLSENVILIEPNKEPIVWYWNLVMFLGGTVFGFAILKSFFRRASSLQEYWKKITEKDES